MIVPIPRVYAATTIVTVTSGGFSPSSVSIAEGDTVLWENRDSISSHSVYSTPHPAHTDYPALNLGEMDKEIPTLDTVTLTFNQSGVYTYHDHLFPALTGSVTVTDSVAPSTISSLATSATTSSSTTLTWTAPGDNAASGTATSYEIRYGTSTINDGNWSASTLASSPPTPQVAGTSQSLVVSGLTANTTYYFAIKATDEVPNQSAVSNVATVTTSAVQSSPGGGSSPDVTAPAAVTNLSSSVSTDTTVDLRWTAPGDDVTTGTVSSYNLRYSRTLITNGNFASATQVTPAPTPLGAGATQTFSVLGLTAGTQYYFALKAVDDSSNTSELSNVINVTTAAVPASSSDTTAPQAIANLAVGEVTSTTVTLTWTASGDDGTGGTATAYDLRYSTAPITAENFISATPVSTVGAPKIGDSAEIFTITGLATGTKHYFAIKVRDEANNWSTISNIIDATPSQPAQPTGSATVVLRDGTVFTDADGEALDNVDLNVTLIPLPTSISFAGKVKKIPVMVQAFKATLDGENAPPENEPVYFNNPVTVKVPVPSVACITRCSLYQFYPDGKYVYVTEGKSRQEKISFTLTHLSSYFVVEDIVEKNDFIDLTPEVAHWAYGIINELHDKDVMNGYDNNTVRPQNSLKRSEAVKLLTLMFRINANSQASLSFDDLPDPEAWYMPYLRVAFERGIITGYEDNTVRPGSDINRAEALAVFVRTLKISNIATYADRDVPFVDVEKGSWYYPFVAFAYETDIVQGMEETQPDGSKVRFFNPSSSITRAEFAKLLTEFARLQ